MGVTLVQFWRSPRAYWCFLVWTLAMMVRWSVDRPYDHSFWLGWWIWTEPPALALLLCVCAESFLKATAELRNAERKAVGLCLAAIGSTIALSAMPVPLHQEFHAEFIAVRQMVHAGLAAFLLFGAMYAWIRPFPVEVYAASHHGILLLWMVCQVAVNIPRSRPAILHVLWMAIMFLCFLLWTVANAWTAQRRESVSGTFQSHYSPWP